MYNLVDFWSEKCLFASKYDPKNHLGQRLYIKFSFRLIRTYWADSYVLGQERKKWTYMPPVVRTGLYKPKFSYILWKCLFAYK